MSEKIEYFFAELDSNLMRGLSPNDALEKTVKNYQYVFEIEPSNTLPTEKGNSNQPMKRPWLRWFTNRELQ